MKFSVRTDYLFEKYSLEDQIRLAHECGADAVEFGEMKGYDTKRAAALSQEYGIPHIACGFYDIWNSRLGVDYREIKDNLFRTVEAAHTLGCALLLGLSGDMPDRSEEQKKIFVENMMPVAEVLEKENLTVLIEPHNTVIPNPVFDFSHYFVNDNALGNELADRIGSPAVKILFDVYHEQLAKGNLFENITKGLYNIRHIHFSGVPGRDEPSKGEVNYPNLLKLLAEKGYDGYIGMEYLPGGDPVTSLKDTLAYLRQ